ncbi:hypothetical protein Tco_1396155, partial [Tanacetum coccineum]
MRIDPTKTQKEPTYQVVLDALALTTCYPAFLITADVPEIYMHPLWYTINKHDSSYSFKIGKKRFTITMEVFREIFQICPRLLTQEFDALLLDEEIVSFIKELGHKGDIKSITKVVVDHMYQPWRTFVAIINKCLSGKITGRLHISNREQRPQEARKDVLYPRFTKAIIHHFITKDKSISIRNKMFMYSAQDDSILVDGDATTYKTYLAYATGTTLPKMKRKFKKPASPSKKRTLVTVEEEEPEPAKKKKAPIKAKKSKGIEVLSDVALLKEDQLKKALNRTKRETNIHQAGGSSEGANFKSKGDSGDETNLQDDEDVQDSDGKPQHANDERTNSKNQETNDDEKETEDEFVHTPPNYVPNDDETNDESNVNEEEYERINEELYGDVNVSLTDVKPANKEKDDDKMTDVGHVYDVVENVNQVKQRALYHALMESILEDEDAIDEGVADKLKKRKPDDANKDEGASARSDRGLKRQKTSKDIEPSKKAKSIETSKGTSKSQPKSTGKSAQADETVFEAGDTQGPQNLR